ncbi:hypothetical protein DSECCO2_586380 [anaerobic digester metagenome]
MQKIFLLICIVLSALLSKAQCPGCLTDTTCTHNPAKPTICPTALSDGYAMQPYQADLSFFLPAEFQDSASGFNVTLNELHVTGVVGMPYGLQFTSSSANNIFYPSSNPPATEHGCARFCGTPLIPGSYVITVYVTAYVTVLGMSQTSDDSFEIPLNILPNPSSNAGFTISNPAGCSPHISSFTANYASNGNPQFSYEWDFGNGNQSSLEAPPSQTYSTPGDYIVTLETTVDTLSYSLSSVTIVNSDCDDPFDDPDYYLKIRRNSTEIFNNSGSYASNNTNPTFTFSPIILEDSTYYINVWENDDFMGGGQAGDDECGTVSFNGHDTGPHTLISGSLVITFTVLHDILTFSNSDTITVYPTPQIASFNAFPDDTACVSDSMQLIVSGGDSWQWYLNGSAIINATDSVYQPTASGEYHVVVSNISGCQIQSSIMDVLIFQNPPYPTFYPSAGQLVTSQTGYSYQWYFEGSPIAGATNAAVDVDQTGYYALELTAANGCSSMSSQFYAVAQSIGEIEYNQVKIYPNPVQNFLFIEPALQNAAWMIYDVTGRMVASGRLDDNAIDASQLESGVYLIRIVTSDSDNSARFVKE